MDWTKINKELGWKPKVKIDEALEKMVRWYTDNQDYWKRIKSGEYQKYYEKQYQGKGV